jgi:hypothetical protein
VNYQYGRRKSELEAPGSPANWRCTALEKFSRVKLPEEAWRNSSTILVPSCVIDADINAEERDLRKGQ